MSFVTRVLKSNLSQPFLSLSFYFYCVIPQPEIIKTVTVLCSQSLKVNFNSLGTHFVDAVWVWDKFFPPMNNQLSRNHLWISSVLNHSFIMLPLSHPKFWYMKGLSLLNRFTVSISAPTLMCLNYKALVNVLISRRTSAHLILFQYYLGYSLTLILLCEFLDQVKMFMKKISGILVWITLDLYINLKGRHWCWVSKSLSAL